MQKYHIRGEFSNERNLKNAIAICISVKLFFLKEIFEYYFQ